MKCTGLILDWPQELEQEHGAHLGQCAQRELIDHKRTVVNTCQVLSWWSKTKTWDAAAVEVTDQPWVNIATISCAGATV